MKNYSAKFWCFLCVFMLASLLVGCDVEKLEYEDDDTYALFDRPVMSPATPEEIGRALDIIATGEPLDDIPWAYSIILDSLLVTVDPEQISYAVFTVQEVADMLSNFGVVLAPWLPHKDFVIEVLKIAMDKSNEPGFDPQNPPKNAALAALTNSLKSGSLDRPKTTDSNQITGDTLLTHGDVLLLLVSMYQSYIVGPEVNELANIIGEILRDNGIHIEEYLPDLESFIWDTTGTEVSAPHQGELAAE